MFFADALGQQRPSRQKVGHLGHCYVLNCGHNFSGGGVVAAGGLFPECGRVLQPNYRAPIIALRQDRAVESQESGSCS
jgi:hypothetical protein